MDSSRSEESNLALFIDFDNIALGLKDKPAKKFEIRLVMERLLEKGKIIIKKAYADWGTFPQYKNELHGAGIEMIEIPKSLFLQPGSASINLIRFSISTGPPIESSKQSLIGKSSAR